MTIQSARQAEKDKQSHQWQQIWPAVRVIAASLVGTVLLAALGATIEYGGKQFPGALFGAFFGMMIGTVIGAGLGLLAWIRMGALWRQSRESWLSLVRLIAPTVLGAVLGTAMGATSGGNPRFDGVLVRVARGPLIGSLIGAGLGIALGVGIEILFHSTPAAREEDVPDTGVG